MITAAWVEAGERVCHTNRIADVLVSPLNIFIRQAGVRYFYLYRFLLDEALILLVDNANTVIYYHLVR